MVLLLLADSHCHLDSFKNPEEIMEKATNLGVSHVLTNATNPANLAPNLLLSQSIKGVKCALGVHPVDLLRLSNEEIEASFDWIESNISRAAAIGEIGLDFKHANAEQRVLQETVFRCFIELALDNNLGVCIHARYAETKCLDILKELNAKKVQMHWFTNSKKTSQRAVELGFKISCGPIILHDDDSALVVKDIPLGNWMLETDAPVPFKGKESDPSWIPSVCKKVAELKQVSAEKVAYITTRNFTGLFGG